MSQWAEIRQMHLVDGVPKKEIARRFGLDVKTVRRAIGRAAPVPQRSSPRRVRRLDLSPSATSCQRSRGIRATGAT